jgi:hypothetical protein
MILRNNVHGRPTLRIGAVLIVVVFSTLGRGVSEVAAQQVAVVRLTTNVTHSGSPPFDKPSSYTTPLLLGMIDTGSAAKDNVFGTAQRSSFQLSTETSAPVYVLQISIFKPAHQDWADQGSDSKLNNSSYSLLEGKLSVGAFMYERYTTDLLPKLRLSADQVVFQGVSMDTLRPLLQLEGGSRRLSVAMKDDLFTGR